MRTCRTDFYPKDTDGRTPIAYLWAAYSPLRIAELRRQRSRLCACVLALQEGKMRGGQ